MSHVPLLSFICRTRSGRNWRIDTELPKEGHSTHGSRSLFPPGPCCTFEQPFLTLASAQKLIWKFDSPPPPDRYGWHISLELLLSFSLFFLFPRARELKALPFLKHSLALPGVHLLFLPLILLFCGINSRLLLKGRLNTGFLFTWSIKLV